MSADTSINELIKNYTYPSDKLHDELAKYDVDYGDMSRDSIEFTVGVCKDHNFKLHTPYRHGGGDDYMYLVSVVSNNPTPSDTYLSGIIADLLRDTLSGVTTITLSEREYMALTHKVINVIDGVMYIHSSLGDHGQTECTSSNLNMDKVYVVFSDLLCKWMHEYKVANGIITIKNNGE